MMTRTDPDGTRRAPETGNAGYGIAPPAYRLPAGTRLGRVTLQVSDLDRSVEYYREVLGLTVASRHDDGAELAAADGEPILGLRERKGATPVPRGGRLGLYHFAILLPGRAALGRLLAHLSRLGIRAGASDHLVSEALYLNDPDGLGIEVYADRPRSEWRQVDGQLVMATEPLDAADLLAAGKGREWRGAPKGTTIGHVHLHVGDIGIAESFYHRGVGFDKVVWSYPGALFLSAGGYHHHLGVNTWASEASPAAGDDARLLEWEIVLPGSVDVDSVAESLSGAGFLPETLESARRVRDPWGTTLRISSDGRGNGDAP